MGCLVLLSLILITLSFRSGEDGPLSGVHSAGATVLKPFAVGFERLAQPFRDAYEWADSLLERPLRGRAPAHREPGAAPAGDPE